MLNKPASESSGMLPITSRSSRSRIRAGHIHRFHRLRLDGGGTALIATVAQGYVTPSTWATAYASLPSHKEPLIRNISFDPFELEQYRQHNSHRSLDWLDSRFMLRLALEQSLADIKDLLNKSPDQERVAGNPERINHSDLYVLRVQGALPNLSRLMERCQDHLLLFQDLRQVHDLPVPSLERR